MADQASTDWIEHDGTGCPVSQLARVQVMFRFDRSAHAEDVRNLAEGHPAHVWGCCWNSAGFPTDIVAYRVVA